MRIPSPTHLTLTFLRSAGFECDIAEKRVPGCLVTKDLYGFIDIVAMKAGETPGLLAVQTTTASNHAARRTKILALPAARLWLACGNRIWVMSWKKTKGKWEPRIEPILLSDFPEAEAA